jgi:hypothetical protein
MNQRVNSHYLKSKLTIFFIGILFLNTSCSDSGTESVKKAAQEEVHITDPVSTPEKEIPPVELKQDPMDYIPKGMVLFDKISGDLNKDGIADLVLMIKGTDKSMFVQDEYRGQLDRNRRGILVLFKHKDGYELASENPDCFSSENEEGGVYYAPELSLDIRKGKLYVEYRHGRYGYWTYTFRYQNADFELIGYDSTNTFGPVIDKERSINFLTKRKQERVNTNKSAESGEEVFEETWKDIKLDKMIKLSEIKDFDELYFPEYE